METRRDAGGVHAGAGRVGNVLSQRISDPESTYHFDALGSTAKLAVEGDLADVTDTYYYDAFGNLLASTGSTDAPFKFVGRLGYYYDEQTGLYWVRARYYDPETGRFASPDPLGDEAGTNRYQLFGFHGLRHRHQTNVMTAFLQVLPIVDEQKGTYYFIDMLPRRRRSCPYAKNCTGLGRRFLLSRDQPR